MLFRLIWRRYLQSGDRVVRVTGWRSALIDRPDGSRRRVWFCPWGLAGLCLVMAGCTTGRLVAVMPDGTRITVTQPKDVTLRGLKWHGLEVESYTSSANVAAVEAQAGLLGQVVGEAVKAAVKP